MSKHTPGPWRVERNRIEYGPFVAGDGWAVATMLTTGDDEETFANARLIAAAPEMWQILASLADCGENGMSDFPDRLANDARALLAKIEP